MVESLLGEFPLRSCQTYLLTYLIMDISERDSKAIEILDENADTQSKESHEIIDIDAIPEFLKPSKYKRRRAGFLNHYIEKIMESKQIRFENTNQEVFLKIECLYLTIK